MKILTLNKSQQKKLLALCKEFFPEEFGVNRLGMEFEEEDGTIILFNGKKFDYVHWYYLCLTELPKRIWKRMEWKKHSYCGIHEILYIMLYNNGCKIMHPVDFLHSFVKDCHKNKYFKNGKNHKN